MEAVNITVDVQFICPAWVSTLIAHDSRLTTMYRVYINDNLLTERSWIWTNNNFIQESIWIYAEKNSPYTITLEPIVKHQCNGTFKLDNFKVANTPFTSEQINDLHISFTLQ